MTRFVSLGDDKSISVIEIKNGSTLANKLAIKKRYFENSIYFDDKFDIFVLDYLKVRQKNISDKIYFILNKPVTIEIKLKKYKSSDYATFVKKLKSNIEADKDFWESFSDLNKLYRDLEGATGFEEAIDILGLER